MEAARIAAMRGHDVTLYEKKGMLGGLLDFASIVKGPHENLQDLKKYLIRQLEVTGVTVKTGTEVTKEMIEEEAPDAVILAVGGTTEGAFLRPSDNRNFEDVDATIVATHLMLAIENEGLGSTWIGFFDVPKLKELFPELKDLDLVALLPVGYKADNAQPSDRHEKRKSKDEFIKVL